jgi:hypothetical protein
VRACVLVYICACDAVTITGRSAVCLHSDSGSLEICMYIDRECYYSSVISASSYYKLLISTYTYRNSIKGILAVACPLPPKLQIGSVE